MSEDNSQVIDQIKEHVAPGIKAAKAAARKPGETASDIFGYVRSGGRHKRSKLSAAAGRSKPYLLPLVGLIAAVWAYIGRKRHKA